MAKKEEKKIRTLPRQAELPDHLSLKVIKAWKHVTRRLAESDLLDEQRAKKGIFWRYVSAIPDKIERYKITKNTKKLYGLNDGEYETLKSLTNAYGIYSPENYDADSPLRDITKPKLVKFERDKRRALEGLVDEQYYAEAA